MTEWIDIIRDAQLFNLLVNNTCDIQTEMSFDVKTSRGDITVQHDSVFPITETSIPNPPTFIGVSDAQSYASRHSTADNLIPNDREQDPAQHAGNLTFVWGSRTTNGITPYRDDGLPAVVVIVGLHKHYQSGKLHREKHPAIRAEYLAAIWYDKNGETSHRSNGPTSVSFENYKEFWTDGVFGGHRWSNFHQGWQHRILNTPEDEDTLGEFLSNLNGDTDMFSSVYFTDVEDEVCYIADFA